MTVDQKKNLTISQHTNTNNYQANFKNPNLYTFSKKTGKVEIRNPKNQLCEDFFYCYDFPQHIEHFLGDIESKYAKLFKKICNSPNMNQIDNIEDKKILIEFIISFYLRTNSKRLEILQWLNIFRIFCFKHITIKPDWIIEPPILKPGFNFYKKYLKSKINKLYPRLRDKILSICPYVEILFILAYKRYSKLNALTLFNLIPYLKALNLKLYGKYQITEIEKMLDFLLALLPDSLKRRFNLNQEVRWYFLCSILQKILLNGNEPTKFLMMDVRNEHLLNKERRLNRIPDYEKWRKENKGSNSPPPKKIRVQNEGLQKFQELLIENYIKRFPFLYDWNFDLIRIPQTNEQVFFFSDNPVITDGWIQQDTIFIPARIFLPIDSYTCLRISHPNDTKLLNSLPIIDYINLYLTTYAEEYICSSSDKIKDYIQNHFSSKSLKQELHYNPRPLIYFLLKETSNYILPFNIVL